MNYFNLSEMKCKDGTPYPEKWRETRWKELQGMLNKIRAEAGVPIEVVSGYRPEAYNKKIGGARRSQHVDGRAADLRTPHPTAFPPRALHNIIWEMYAAGKLPELGGLGLYPTFVHVDTRDTERLVRWNGSRV
jgi:uncharacterized protein YcbK (DUF882 family)